MLAAVEDTDIIAAAVALIPGGGDSGDEGGNGGGTGEFAGSGLRGAASLAAAKAVLGEAYTEGRRKDVLSIVYMTMRPGGYDVLLHSLARQSSQEFELLCVDELAAPGHRSRAGDIRAMANALGLGDRVTYIGPSDPRPPGTHFGIANAINSGLRRTRGRHVTILQDFVWVPEHFVAHTLRAMRRHPRVLLGYIEQQYVAPVRDLDVELPRESQPHPLSVFNLRVGGCEG